MLLPTKVRIILEIWRCVLSNVSVSISKQLPQMNYYPHTHIIDPNLHNIRITYVCLNQDEMSRLLFLDSKFFTETFIISPVNSQTYPDKIASKPIVTFL